VIRNRIAAGYIPDNEYDTQRRRNAMLTIKVLGPGCTNCKNVELVARQAVAALAVEAEVIKVTQYEDIKKYALLSTPGLVINEKVVCAGRIPTQAEVTTWLASAL
jgi:small redox-active disulfide protein 2